MVCRTGEYFFFFGNRCETANSKQRPTMETVTVGNELTAKIFTAKEKKTQLHMHRTCTLCECASAVIVFSQMYL